MENKTYFDGKFWPLFGRQILGGLISSITLGICTPWAICMIYEWEINNTVIEGRRLEFVGKPVNLLGNWIKWILLTIVTLGIYGFYIPVQLRKWKVKNIIVKAETPSESSQVAQLEETHTKASDVKPYQAPVNEEKEPTNFGAFQNTTEMPIVEEVQTDKPYQAATTVVDTSGTDDDAAVINEVASQKPVQQEVVEPATIEAFRPVEQEVVSPVQIVEVEQPQIQPEQIKIIEPTVAPEPVVSTEPVQAPVNQQPINLQ